MKTWYIKVLKGFAAFIIVVTVLYLGQTAWNKYAIGKPLDKALMEISGVEKVTWDGSYRIKDEIIIDVVLGNTANLQKTYSEINNTIKDTLKGKEYVLEIKDNRSPELEKAYYDIHFYIQKSIVDGDFPSLLEKAQEKAKIAGAESRLYVDEDNIYLQLINKSNSLFAVVSRKAAGIGGNLR